MSQESKPGSKSPSWRDSGSAGASKPARSKGSWRSPKAGGQSTAGSSGRQTNWRRVLGKLLAGISAVLFALLFWWGTTLIGCTQTEMIVTGATEYSGKFTVIPPNLYAEQDATALESLQDAPRFIADRVHDTAKLAERFARVPSGKVLLVFVGLNGTADAQAGYIIPDNADADIPTSFVNLDILWNALRTRPAEQRKLVLLDLSRLQNDWRTGVLENRYQDRIAESIQNIENLTVITSCSAGEKSWASRDLGPENGAGQSVFGNFLVQGLAGAADRDGNQQVTADELFGYLNRNVSNWVRLNRDAAGQHPLLIRSNDKSTTDYVVVAGRIQPGDTTPADTTSEGAVPVPPPASAGSTENLERRLQQLWARKLAAEANLKQAPYHWDPLRWRLLTFRLMRAEEWQFAKQPTRAQVELDRAEDLFTDLAVTANPNAFADTQAYPFVTRNLGQRVLHAITATPNDAAPARIPDSPPQRLAATARELPKELAPLAATAVEIRELAEQAASPPLGVLTSTHTQLAAADAVRRTGEDSLFVADTQPAKTSFQKARESYTAIRDANRIIGNAMQACNRLNAELPEWARWASVRMPLPDSSHRTEVLEAFTRALAEKQLPDGDDLNLLKPAIKTNDDTLDAIEIDLLRLFDTARPLERLLAEPSTLNQTEKLSQLQSLTQAGNDQLDDLHSRFRRYAITLAESRTTQPQATSWQQIRDVLASPFVPSETRRTLRGLLASYSKELHGEHSPQYDQPAPAPSPTTSPTTGNQDALTRPMWSAIWAIDSLSLGGEEEAGVQRLWDAWIGIWRNVQRGEMHEVARLGELIRQSWLEKRQRVRQLTANETREVDEKRFALLQAALTARSVDPCDAERLLVDFHTDPVRDLRSLHRSEMLLTHTQRYLDDYWADWYEAAAGECLTCVQSTSSPLFKHRIGELEDLLKGRRSAYIQLRGPNVRFGTSMNAGVSLVAERVGAVPAGIAGIRLTVPEGGPVVAGRTTWEKLDTTASTSNLEFALSKKTIFDDQTECPMTVNATPEVFYRGHRWKSQSQTIAVDPCRPQGVHLTYTPAPPTGRILVRGADRRSILFILDCSKSMEQALGDGTRFTAALDTMRATLVALQGAAPPANPYRVGLMAYGHRVQKLKGSPIQINPNWPPPPAAIAADYLLDIEILNPVRPLNLKALQTNLAKLRAWGNTPLLGAIADACSHFEQLHTSGTIVAITDGVYSDAGQLQRLDGTLKNARRQGYEIDLHIVGFALDNADERQRLADLIKTTGGQFHQAPTAGQLANAIKNAVTPRPYRITALDRTNSFIFKLGSVSDPISTGRYSVGLGDVAPIEFAIAGGENLQFELTANGLRHVDASSKLKLEVAAEAQNLRLGYQSFREIPQNASAEIVLSLVNNDDRTVIPRPAEMNFEVQPLRESDRQERPTHWRVVEGESSPTWAITIDEWPRGSGIVVNARWKSKATAPDVVLPWNKALSSPEFSLPFPDNNGLQLRVLPPVYSADKQSVTVTLQTTDRSPTTPRTPLFYDHLARIKIHLADITGGSAPERPWSREFIESEEQLVYTISVPDGFRPEQASIDVTSWQSQITGAVSLPRPLQVARP